MSLLLRDLLLEYEFEVLEKLGHQIRPQIRDLNYGRRHPPQLDWNFCVLEALNYLIKIANFY